MLIEEAKWIGKRVLQAEAASGFPLLNIGSSTGQFRTQGQPWIDAFIFRPLREAHKHVVHSDIRQADGVDLVGDITSAEFAQSLKQMDIKSVMCSNLLEHVTNREAIARAIMSVVPVGGLVFASCPRDYPYHADPIDNGFRPSPGELARLFPGTQVLEGEIVQSGTYGSYLMLDRLQAAKMVVRLFAPFYRPMAWVTLVNHWLWLFRRFSATCVVLRKIA